MDKKQILNKLIELEHDAIDTYLNNANIAVKEYINPETMGLLEYQNYVELYFQHCGECFECEEKPCDEGCPYQFNKESEEQTNESLE